MRAFHERVQIYKEKRAAYDAKRYAKNKFGNSGNQISREEVKQKETRRRKTTQTKTIVSANIVTGSGSRTSSSNKMQKSTETMRKFAQTDIMKANQLALEEIPFEFQPHKKPKKLDNWELIALASGHHQMRIKFYHTTDYPALMPRDTAIRKIYNFD